MNKRSSALFALILLLGIGFIYRDAMMMIARHSVHSWSASARISRSLDNAKSVVFVEFDETGDTVRVAAGPKEVAELRRATNRWLIPSVPKPGLCFDPHHRVDVAKADGSMFQFAVCFECRGFLLEDSAYRNIFTLPDPWIKPLAALFKSVGMNPLNAERSRAATESPEKGKVVELSRSPRFR